MVEELDTSWFDLKNYEALKPCPLQNGNDNLKCVIFTAKRTQNVRPMILFASMSALSQNKALPWSHRLYERFAENWIIEEVTKIYDGNICNLSREQVIRLLEAVQ